MSLVKNSLKEKAVIIGAGRVGASIAFSVALQNLVNEIILIDTSADKAKGEALDLVQGLSYYNNVKISAGDYADCENAKYIIITAGASQAPNQTRLDLAETNHKIVKQICQQILPINNQAFFIMVTNPVDVLTYVAIKALNLPTGKVFGTGTILDTSRFRFYLGDYFKVSPSNVHAFIIGEHGDTSFPVLSSANIAGILLSQFNTYNQDKINDFYYKTRDAAYEIIKLKGATHFSIAQVTCQLIQSIKYNENKIYPVSIMLGDVCLSIPCVVGSQGATPLTNFKMNSSELKLLETCAIKIKTVVDSLN